MFQHIFPPLLIITFAIQHGKGTEQQQKKMPLILDCSPPQNAPAPLQGQKTEGSLWYQPDPFSLSCQKHPIHMNTPPKTQNLTQTHYYTQRWCRSCQSPLLTLEILISCSSLSAKPLLKRSFTCPAHVKGFASTCPMDPTLDTPAS